MFQNPDRSIEPKVLLFYVKGLRATPERVAVCVIFQNIDAPLCAEEIFDILKHRKLVTKTTSLSTIYRILAAFEKAKIIAEIDVKKMEGIKQRRFYKMC